MSAPTLRAAMELDCTRISRGEDTKEAVVERCISKMKECFKTCVAVRAVCRVQCAGRRSAAALGRSLATLGGWLAGCLSFDSSDLYDNSVVFSDLLV